MADRQNPIQSWPTRGRIRRGLLALGLLLASGIAHGEVDTPDASGVPHVRSGPQPAEGSVTWPLEEVWRVGGDDEALLLGSVAQVMSDSTGSVYVLDRQLAHVVVVAPDGTVTGVLGREGEGPGETRRPGDMLFLSDGTIGLVQGFPGRIVKIDRAGNPAGTIHLGGDASAGTGMSSIHDARLRGGTLALCGWRGTQRGSVFERTSFLSICDPDFRERQLLLSKPGQTDFSQPRYIESEEYFVGDGRWALGPDGRVYAAPERDQYIVQVYASDGTLARIIEREFESWARTREEMDRLGEARVAVVDGRRMEFETRLEPNDPCIRTLHVAASGDLWVLSSRGAREQAPGVMATYDVFDRDGRFARQVAVACPGDPDRDQLFFLDDGRVILAIGASSGGGQRDEGEAVPQRVVCYRVAK